MYSYKLTVCAILSTYMLTGCGASTPPIVPDLEYRKIPEAYLQKCQLPPVPLDTGDLSDAFMQAYQCGEQGNRDKQRIRALTDETDL